MPMRQLTCAVSIAIAGLASAARAYTVETVVTDGCHERITQDALRSARAQSLAAVPLAAESDDDRALLSDLEFSRDADMRDLGAAALLLGLRDNDLRGINPSDLAGLAIVQNDPDAQDAHCLRRAGDVEPNGTANAAAACRAFIRAHVASALDFLDANGAPDPSARDALAISLAVRGEVTAPLPGFYVHLGQALHALQDSVAHSYRTSDGRTITEILNWLDVAADDLDEATEGPAHNVSLDRCVALDPLRDVRLGIATDESTALILAALGPGTRTERLAQVDSLLDADFKLQTGCSAANNWCDAPERSESANFVGCSTFGESGLACFLLLLALALASRVRHATRDRTCGNARPHATGAAKVSASLALVLCALASPALAQTDETAALERRFSDRPAWGLSASLGGALDHTAVNVSVGGRLRLDPHWLIGLDAEWNPWFSLSPSQARPGAFNVYASAVRRWPLLNERLDLRTTLRLGSSTILFPLFGVPTGTTGLYLGASLLSLEWETSRTTSLILDPADVAFPMPQLHGAPYAYLQYRFTVSFQWGG
ncbi:MAG: hypothetical protein JST92_05335 [Deltaproteobacteria bacterium]|nr:hypothetical protein [Deltaproteobacteria bacterium]